MTSAIFRSAFCPCYRAHVSTSTNPWKQADDCSTLCPAYPLLTALTHGPRELDGPFL